MIERWGAREAGYGIATWEGRSGRVEVARVADRPPAGPALRVLVDRLWPRGVAPAEAPWDAWLPALAPTTGLGRWYGRDPQRREEFSRRYRLQLQGGAGLHALQDLRDLASGRPVLLLTSARSPESSQAAVLAGFLNGEAD